MNEAKYVHSIETLTINNNIEVYRVTTENGEQIIGLPMFTSQKSWDDTNNLTVTMLYIPNGQTVMNIVDIKTSSGDLCTIEPSGKHLIQLELQCFWYMNKKRLIQAFNEKSEL